MKKIILLILAILISIPSIAAADTFGSLDTTGTHSWVIFNGFQVGSGYIATGDGPLDSTAVLILGDGSSDSARAAIYLFEDSSLVAVSPWSLFSHTGVDTIYFSFTGVEVTSGTAYVCMVFCGSGPVQYIRPYTNPPILADTIMWRLGSGDFPDPMTGQTILDPYYMPTMFYFTPASSGPPDTLLNVLADSTRDDFSGEADSTHITFDTPDYACSDCYVKLAWSDIGFPDSAIADDTLHLVYGQDSSYSAYIIFEGTEPYTLYISGWMISAANGWSQRVEWQITLDSPDTYPPDVHSFSDALYWSNINPDICRLAVGHIDSTDYDTTIIRYGPTMPASRTDGSLLWTGGALENDTSDYNLAADSGWVYFRIFGGDANGNWNTGAADSLFMPGAEPSSAILRNGLYEFMMGENRRW